MAKIFDKINLLKKTSVNNNLLINGNFDIWQRGTSFINNGYSADRWYLSVNGGVRAYRMVGGASLENSDNFIRIQTTSSGSYGTIAQAVSSDITSQIRGSYVNFSFYAKCPTGTTNNWSGNVYTRCFYGLDTDNLINRIPIENSSYNSPISVNNTWTKYSNSFFVPNNAANIYIEILPSGALAANSIIDIAQVKLETGTSSTPLKPLTVNEELENCQLYYQKVDVKLKAGTGYGSGSSRKFGMSTPLPKAPRTSSIKIDKLTTESNDSLLSNVKASITNNQYLTVIADSNSPYSELESVFAIDNEIYPAAVPGVVDNVQIIRSSDNLNITWDPAIPNNSPITYYSVYYDTNPVLLNNSVSFTGVSGTVSGVNAASTYHVRLLATNDIGTGTLSNLYTVGPLYTVPSSIITAAGTWANDVTNLSWSVPTGDGGSPITGYNVQRSMYSNYSTIDLSYYTINNFASLTKSSQQVTATGSYYFKVAALNLAGTGAYTNFTVPKTTPFPPTNLSTLSENAKVTLYYSNPTGNGGDPISLVDILYSTSSSFSSSTGVSYTANFNPIVVTTGITNGVTYYFKIRSYNNLGYSNYGQTVSAVPNRTLTVPGTPTGLISYWQQDAFTPTDHEAVYNIINLTWGAPLDDGGTPIINYQAAVAADSGFATGILTTSTINSNRSLSITFPTGSTNYPFLYLRVRANNNIGSSSWSSGLLLSDQVPGATTINSINPGNTTGIVYYYPSYYSNGAPITGYALQHSTSSTFSSPTTIINTSNTCNACSGFYSNVLCTGIISNLVNNTTYYVRVAAINSSGTGTYSNIMSFTPFSPITVPSKPLNLAGNRITSSGTSTISNIVPIYLTSDPGNMVNYRSTINQVYAIPIIGSTNQIVWGCNNLFTDDSSISSAAVHQGVVSSGQSAYVFIRMLPGASSYTSCTKNGVTTNSWGSWYGSYSFVSASGCVGNNGILLSWSSPAINGGATITGYAVQSGSNTGFTGFAPTVTTSNLSYSSCVSSGAFYVRTAAINSVGTGSWSDTLGISGIKTAPSVPRNLVVTTGGFSGNAPIINMNWSAPIDFGNVSTLEPYLIQYRNIQKPTYAYNIALVGGSTNAPAASTSHSFTVPYGGTWQITMYSTNGQFQYYSDPVYASISITGNNFDTPTTWTFTRAAVYTDAFGNPRPGLTSSPTQKNLIDGSPSWANEVGTTTSISGIAFTADFGSTKQINNIYYAGIYGSSYSYPLSPINGTLIQGSNNNTVWYNITTLSGLSAQITYQIPVNVAYRYIRLFAKQNSTRNYLNAAGSYPTAYLQVGKLYFS